MGKEQPGKDQGTAGKILDKTSRRAGGAIGSAAGRGAAMYNSRLTEEESSAICAAWAAIGNKGRAAAEAQLLGSVIVGIYPITGAEAAAGGMRKYQAGLSILYRQPGQEEVKTLDIMTSCSSRDDEITMTFENGFVLPEESMTAIAASNAMV